MGQSISIQDLISIIVPVYNTEKYLDQCIQSVLTQTYTNWELLLIDDGSTDSSGAICDKYAAEDNRIKVVHKPNTGVSDSKNIALDMAKGEYIMFLDSDDYWCINDCIAQLYAKSQELGVDIVRGEYKAVDEAGNLLFKRALNATKQQAVNKLLTPYQFLTEVLQGEFFLVLTLFKRNTINHIRFNSHRMFLEDMELYARILQSNDSMSAYLPLRFYAYRKHDQTVSAGKNPRKLQDSFAMCQVFHECRQVTKDQYLREYFERYSIMMYYWTLDTISQDDFYASRHNLIESLSLITLRTQVIEWTKTSEKRYPILIKLPCNIAIIMFRLKHSIGNIIRNIKKH